MVVLLTQQPSQALKFYVTQFTMQYTFSPTFLWLIYSLYFNSQKLGLHITFFWMTLIYPPCIPFGSISEALFAETDLLCY